jgi:AAA ATPase domain
MTTRVASSRLIGRSAELAELEAALAEAADGHPSLAFVAGESGVGKTRLVTERMRSARDRGALVLAVDSVDFGGESEMPYQPLVAAFRPLTRGTEQALTDSVRDAVAPLLPGLAAHAARPAAGRRPRQPGAARRGPAVAPRRPRAGAPGDAGERGLALGRPLDSGSAGVPGEQPDERAGPGRGLVPVRRAAPPPPAAARCWPSSSSTRARAASRSPRSRATSWPSS